MRTLVLAAGVLFVISLTGCLSQQEKDENERAAVAKRIDEICALPPAERDAALERLKKQSGIVLVCGNDKKQ